MMPASEATSRSAEAVLAAEICAFLQSPFVNSLFNSHPNQLCSSSFVLPYSWNSWWTWAGELTAVDALDPKWVRILRCYVHSDAEHDFADADSDIPQELRTLLQQAQQLQITRRPGPALPVSSLRPPPSQGPREDYTSCILAPNTPESDSCVKSEHFLHLEDRLTGDVKDSSWARGMSPKKAHEVSRMAEYVARLLGSSGLRGVEYVVDVGAGQAYLSRKLRDDLGLHVLALDWSDVQSKGAARRDTPTKSECTRRNNGTRGLTSEKNVDDSKAASSSTPTMGSLVYKTVSVTPTSLLDATEEWLLDFIPQGDKSTSSHTGASFATRGPVPVLLAALHACGSLTPSILRVFANSLKTVDVTRCWVPRAAVIVGCCYNLLDAADFPLSHAISSTLPSVTLTPNHMQLAAQVPTQWLNSELTMQIATLAVRKVAWRALLEIGIEAGGQTHDRDPPRLGRLNDSAYADWDTFLARAGGKIGIDWVGRPPPVDRVTESRLEVFHVLRCILGPVVESLILLDRQQWMAEQLKETEMGVQLINLFDQAAGSGRNVAIVVVPALNPRIP